MGQLPCSWFSHYRGLRGDKDDKLAFQGALLRECQQLRRIAAQEFLEFFSQFTCENDLPFGKDFVQLSQNLFNSIRRLIEHKRTVKAFQRLQLFSTLAGLVGEKTDEMEFLCRQSTGRERGYESARPWNRFDAEACGDGCFDDAFTGIADAGAAGVRDKGHFLTTAETFY